MPVLKNHRHELFAQEVAKGKGPSEAYHAAGFETTKRGANASASRLLATPSVSARVKEIQERRLKIEQQGTERAIERFAVTAESLMRDAARIMKAAEAAGQHSAAIAAVKELGVLSGQRIERREQGKPGEFDNMSDHELDAWIAAEKASLGAGHSGGEAPQVAARVRGKPH